jgi:hypothetical protein
MCQVLIHHNKAEGFEVDMNTKNVMRWKFLLPLVQLPLAMGLWLYIPVQLKMDLLRAMHLPSEHPYRLRTHAAPEAKEFFSPPACGRVLYVMNFPVDSVTRQVIIPFGRHIALWKGSPLPEWEFTLPVTDTEALEPRKIFYPIHPDEIVFFGGLILLWYWVGSRIDEFLDRRRGVNRPRRKVFRIIELTVILSLVALSVFNSYRLIVYEYPHYRQVGIFGLIWPALLLAYCWFAVRREKPQPN